MALAMVDKSRDCRGVPGDHVKVLPHPLEEARYHGLVGKLVGYTKHNGYAVVTFVGNGDPMQDGTDKMVHPEALEVL